MSRSRCNSRASVPFVTCVQFSNSLYRSSIHFINDRRSTHVFFLFFFLEKYDTCTREDPEQWQWYAMKNIEYLSTVITIIIAMHS